ncbi:hypothetical protein [Arsenicicoccus dermatophilus]|uniref:hypothetical protein n=1 Tax=Arsenicicoccus dermatophilus TaxID=1076331 RepID=UPI001F4C6690|nr:hypothetical protein [Arsenicicoccus dermatophilus]MCH8613487.1 hypothetical protein [Arsenicicoccus dermatophilus]
MNAYELAAGIFGGIVTVILAVLQRDRKDAKQTPITQDDRIAAGGGDLAYVLGIAKAASERAEVAEARAARAEAAAAEATRRADAAENRSARSEEALRLITDWAHAIVQNWTALRQRETPPDLPDLP